MPNANTTPNNPVTRVRSPRRRKQKASRYAGLRAIFQLLLGLSVLVMLCSIVLLVVVAVLNLTNRDADLLLGDPAPTLNPVERAYLEWYLRQNAAELLVAPSPDDTGTVNFTVAPGETATTVAANLSAAGLIRDADLLVAYLRWRGWDGQIEAGTIPLSPSFPLYEIAASLTDALPNQVAFTIWAGWRIEQVAESLASHPYLDIDGANFLAMARREAPLPYGYQITDLIPPDQTLEGFLLPGNYNLPPLATEQAAIDLLLRAFEAQVYAPLALESTNVNLSPYQVVILASIIQREAVHTDEMPRIASVYLNRIAIDMRLEADPTTQYGLGLPGAWWPPLNFSPREFVHPYNTYVIFGLPPGPIANPSAAAITAVLNPDTTPYYFFRAACDGSGYHNFAETYEQHLANGCN